MRAGVNHTSARWNVLHGSLRQASRYTAALETAAARAAEIRETQAQAEAELLSRFAPVAVPARSRSASDTVPSQSRSEFFIKREPAVLDPYDAAVKKITAKYGPPTKTKSGELFWSLPDRRLTVTRSGWKTTYEGVILAHGSFDTLEELVRL